jgi:hypothetical protein
MTKKERLAKAEKYEKKIEALLAAGEDGTYLEYLHAKTAACRFLAVDAEGEDE